MDASAGDLDWPEIPPSKVYNFGIVNLNTKEIGVAWISCRLFCVVVEYLHYCPMPSMEPVMIRVVLIGNIDTNPIPKFKPSHRSVVRSALSC